jgi:hypothetical protein
MLSNESYFGCPFQNIYRSVMPLASLRNFRLYSFYAG